MSATMEANPAMIVLARESRGYTQSALAAKLGVSQGTISKAENRQRPASDDLIRRLATLLDYPPEFFYQEYRPRPLPLTFYRKRIRVSLRTLNAVRALMNLRRLDVEKLMRSADLPEVRVPTVNAKDFRGDIERIGREVRIRWRLAPGPIENVTRTLEDAGVLVIRCDFGTDLIDALSVYDSDDGLPPMILANPTMSGDRWRLTLAHELGHLILHHHLVMPPPDTDMEREAFRFAAEFLMPTAEIRGHLTRLTLEKLASLKPHWKVSMGALLERAAHLGKITERQRRHLWMVMGRHGYRTSEPIAIPTEQPTLVSELVEFHLHRLGYSERDLSKLLTLGPAEFRYHYSSSGGIRAVK